MALDTCLNCPPGCLGMEYSTDCGYITKDIASKGITKGDSLTGVLEKIAVDTSSPVASNEAITTDDIITMSLIRNPSALCASNIVVRDFEYTLKPSLTTSTFSWNMLGISNGLPKGYEIALTRVIATGTNSGNGTIVFDTKKLSAGSNIGLDRFPVTVDFNIRVLSPCGNIDMHKRVYLSSPAQKGTSRTFMLVNDLLPGSTEDLKLTQQLDILESGVQLSIQKIDAFEQIKINGINNDIKQIVATHDGEIAELQDVIAAPSIFSISYSKDGLITTGTIATVFADLYTQINLLKGDLAQKQVEIDTLQSQVATLL